MKKILLLILLISQTTIAQWSVIGNTNLASEEVRNPNIAVDANDVVYVAYNDAGDFEAANIFNFNGSSWSPVGPLQFTGCCIGVDVKIQTDNTQVPHVFFKGTGAGTADVRRFDGSNWVSVGAASLTETVFANYDFVIDSNNNIYVAFDANPTRQLLVKRYNGSIWETVGSGTISGASVTDVSIALDNSNMPYVAYRDFDNGGRASVQRFDGTNWITVGTAGFSSGSADDIDIQLDNNNIPYVIFHDQNNAFKASVMRYVSGSWQYVGGEAFTAGSARLSQIGLSGTKPYIVYSDGANGSKAVCKTLENGNWVTFGAEGFSSGVVSGINMVINNDNTSIYVVVRDNTTSSPSFGATAFVYNSPTLSFDNQVKDNEKVFVDRDFILNINGITSTLNTDIKMYDITGKLVFETSAKVIGSYTAQLPTDLLSGVYIVRIESSLFKKSLKTVKQ